MTSPSATGLARLKYATDPHRKPISRMGGLVAVRAEADPHPQGAGARGGAELGLVWGALGPRQRAVAEGVLAGETNAQIAARLDMSVHTVREHLKRMAARLAARGRAGLIAGLEEARRRAADAPAAPAAEPAP